MLDAAIARYKALLRKGIRAARALDSTEEIERLEELDTVRVQILERTRRDYWTRPIPQFTITNGRCSRPLTLGPVVEAFEISVLSSFVSPADR